MKNHSILLRASTTCYGLLWYERPDAHLFRTGPVWGDCDQPSNHAHAIMPGKRTSKIPNYSSCDFRKFVCINCLYIYIVYVYIYIYIYMYMCIYIIYIYIYIHSMGSGHQRLQRSALLFLQPVFWSLPIQG